MLIITSLSCIVFRYIVRPFSDEEYPDIGAVPILSPEQTLELLNSIGLGFLTYSGPFCTVILLYLYNLGNLIEALNLNLST